MPPPSPIRPRRRATGLVALGLLAAGLNPAQAATWYVRTDGGDATQCDGRTDAPSPAAGRACAWRHPFVALPPGGPARIAGGDTLVIGAGAYGMGLGALDAGACTGGRTCHMGPVPSGQPGLRTRILGQGHAEGCAAPPVLWGRENASRILNLEGSSHVEVGCLDVTDRSDCVYLHVDPAARCNTDFPPLGDWAGTALYASASRDVWLHDLHLHGMAHSGIHAGGLADWWVERVRLVANGWAGWDGNIGPDTSSNSGYIVLRNVEIAWNGCAERWQTRVPWACWGEQTGGYGDGLGTGTTGGQWLLEDSSVHHNTSDGFDLRYLGDDIAASATVRRVHAYANAGNQIKLRGAATVDNALVVGWCSYFAGRDSMQSADLCRASGEAISLVLVPGRAATVRHSTITGDGRELVTSSEGDAGSSVLLQNNLMFGQPTFRNPMALSVAHFAFNSPAQVFAGGNLYWRTENHACAGNVCGQDPRVADERLATFDATLLPGSAAVDRVPPFAAIDTDLRGVPRPWGPASDIGAIELRPLPPLGGRLPPQATTVSATQGAVPLAAATPSPDEGGDGGWWSMVGAWGRVLAEWVWRVGPSRLGWWLAT